MRYKGKRPRGLTALQVVAAVLTVIVIILAITTFASARMMRTDPAEDFAWCMTHEVDLT